MVLPWPDSLAVYIAALIHGKDERGRMMRRNIMRYTLLSYVITLRRISFRVRKRFPTMDHVIDAGLVRAIFNAVNITKIFEIMEASLSNYQIYLHSCVVNR